MGVRQRLARLDSRVIPGLRQPGEPAEAFLRRTIARRNPSAHATSADVIAALREYFRELDQRAEGDREVR